MSHRKNISWYGLHSSREIIFVCVLVVTLVIAATWYKFGTQIGSHQIRYRMINGHPMIDFPFEERYWETQIAHRGASSAHQIFLESTLGPDSLRHAEAHTFGEALFKSVGLGGIGICGNEFGEGCIHSFFGFAMKESGISVVHKLETLCTQQSTQYKQHTCEHGIGHGLIGYAGYTTDDLIRSLELCKNVASSTDFTLGCAGGAFMEHNLRTLLKGDGILSRQTVNGDVFDPCDQIPKKYRASCLFWQPPWWFRNLTDHRDYLERYKIMSSYCATLSNDERYACFAGIGYDIPLRIPNDDKKAATTCREISPSEADATSCIAYALSTSRVIRLNTSER